MNTFKINKLSFINDFLKPINKICEKCVINLEGNKAFSVVTDQTSSIVLACFGKLEEEVEQLVTLNINDISKLQRVINCIEEENPEFQINENHIQYKSKNLKFKYHLLENGIIPKSTINLENLSKLEFNTSFNIEKEKLEFILRNSSFSPDVNKIYFYTRDGSVFCELNDKTIKNLDSMEIEVAESYSGESIQKEIALRLDWLKNFSGLKIQNLNVMYNKSNNIIIFRIKNGVSEMKYIVSTLTK